MVFQVLVFDRQDIPYHFYYGTPWRDVKNS